MKKILFKILAAVFVATCSFNSYAAGTDATQTSSTSQPTFSINTFLNKSKGYYQWRSGASLKQSLQKAGFKVKSTSSVRMFDGINDARMAKGVKTVWTASGVTVEVEECKSNVEINIVFGNSTAKDKFIKGITAAGWEKSGTYNGMTDYDGELPVWVEGNKVCLRTYR